MTMISCVKCKEDTLQGNLEPPAMCGSCRVELEEEITKISRKNDRYTRRGKLKNRLSDIPDDAIPESMALKIEEVADPEIENRQYKLGRIEELKMIGDKEIESVRTDFTDYDRGKMVVKKRYR